MRIEQLTALEILDSRGRPTVQATCRLSGGARATASVPSGASTGTAEAWELRDGDAKRYGGLGTRRAVANVEGEIADALMHRDIADQSELDRAMTELDGTRNKSRLGANAILAVSIAFARAAAAARGVPLYAHLADMVGEPIRALPRLTINLFSGGKHAGRQVPIQDVLLVPCAAATIDDGLAAVYAVYQAAAELSLRKYGMRALKADEGGLAPPFQSVEQMLDDAVEAIRNAGFQPGAEVALAIDVASSHFHRDGMYCLAERMLDSGGMIDVLSGWVSGWPIVSVEDGLAENDWDAWPALLRAIGGRALVLGDDLLCTNPQRIARAVASGAANALLLKLNQIGTLTEAAEARRLAKAAGWPITISARSGETEDNWLADLAVGWAGEQIKVGSIAQSDRLSKYNRLLTIEAETNLPIVDWPRRS
ncbi:MAG TPA: phosphopyruvate hydratase [Tepidisphaeraceae bacterium]|nr:phosphopyruvate hydratase [Tepidisphaeraceae bacterium]